MKKLITLVILLGIFALSLVYHDEISEFITESFNTKNEASALVKNDYTLDKDYEFAQTTDNFSPKTQEDIKNIYYTIIDSGMDNFVFYCDKNYKNCLDDVDYISNNQKLLSYMNNFAPVFNNFKNIETEFDSLGKVSINVTHSYSKEQIDAISNKMDEIIKNNITTDMNAEAKIKTIHDYIINNTKYDIDRSDNKVTKYHSDNAYGALIEGYAICGGYADSMKLFLDYFDIPNFKISSENHIWNAVYLNDNWYHLDLTWDDPVTSTGEDILEYNYFLITTDELLELENEQHTFDIDIYNELKEA